MAVSGIDTRNAQYAYHPKSRQKFWGNKFQKTVLRDKTVTNSLLQLGWFM